MLLDYVAVIGGLIIVSIRPDKIAGIQFVGGFLLRMKVPDKKTVPVRLSCSVFLFVRRKNDGFAVWKNQTNLF